MDPNLVIAALFGLIGLWNLMIAVLGLFPKCRATAVGTLASSNTRRNVPGFRRSKIPIQTHYIYVYTVHAKQYRYASTGSHTKSRLFPKVTMVYVKWFPCCAYPEKFTGIRQWVMAVVMFLGMGYFILRSNGC